VIDASFRPVYANPESIKILGFPNAVSHPASMDGVLTQKILSFFAHPMGMSQGTSITQFQSGRRRYLCRSFIVENHWSGSLQENRIALLLERVLPGPPASTRKQRRLAGMAEDPFGFSPDPKYYHFSRANQEVFASLRSMIREGRGVGVLCAQTGMGKTILLNYLAENLRRESVIAVFPGSFKSRAELVQAVMVTLGVDETERDLSGNLRHFKDWLLSKNLAGQRVTLVCDNAHDFALDTLENLCLFSDLEMGQLKLIQIVLAGRQRLLEKLTDLQLRATSKKINVFCKLAPMDEGEVRSYVLHRLRITGCTQQLFSSAALSSIALYSRGIPLNVNMICRHSLSLAAAISRQVIDERIIEDSAYDLVLRSQPANMAEGSPGPPFSEPPRRSDLLRDRRRGLKLIRKPKP
jgi:type II secretory pathway predicted ATPase ExeA